MKGLNSTIKSRLISTATGITIILISLGFITNYNLQNTFSQYSLLSRIDKINAQELELRKLEKDFMLKESSNIDFFKTGTSQLLDSFTSTLNNIGQEIHFLKENEVISDLGLFQNMTLIETGFDNYQRNFEELKKQIIQKGFKDFGLVGQMRDQIHAVESIVDAQNNLLFTKYMLMLRRHEKDYLLRKDLKYKDKFDELIESFNQLLSSNTTPDNKQIVTYLKSYQQIFHKVIEKDIIIGLQDDKGLMRIINEDINQIENNLTLVHSKIYQNSKHKIARATLTLFAMITLLSVVILVFLYRDSKYIVSSIKSLYHYINRLGKGELPVEIEIKGADEIADMRKSINMLTDNLKQTRDFVIEVGNGNFLEEINVFNGEGELGSNLLNMRKKLLQVSSEREQQQKEAEQRMWNNEGIGLFSEILRKNSNDIEELSYQIVKNLVKYLKANQGGIFIRDDEKKENIYFDLIAAYAYDRKKFMERRILLGEGILGTCAIEAETIYMTDIPNHYIEITSGLGKANPTSLLIVPLKREDEVLGVLELASFNYMQKFEIEFIEKIAENVASHLYFVQMNIKTNKLLQETQRQTEEMSSQEEEMRQNMEELTVTQERLASREEELLMEIEDLKTKNKKLFQKLIENGDSESEFEYESAKYQN